MRLLKCLFWILYRSWFYVLAGAIIVLVAPAMLIFLSRLQWYPTFYKLARLWGRILLAGMAYRCTTTSATPLEKAKNYMFGLMLLLVIFQQQKNGPHEKEKIGNLIGKMKKRN